MDLTGTKVFLVEDEAMIAMLLENILEELNCQVIAVADRLDIALEKAQSVQADVALLDVNLAGKMSYPVAAVLRGRGIPFVFATAYGVTGLPQELGDSLVLSKPFPWTALRAALIAAIKGAPRVALAG